MVRDLSRNCGKTKLPDPSFALSLRVPKKIRERQEKKIDLLLDKMQAVSQKAAMPPVAAMPIARMPPPENPPADYIMYYLANPKCQQLVDLIHGSSVLRPRIVCHEVTDVLQAQPWFQQRNIKHVPALYDCKNPANTRFGTDAKEFIEMQHKVEMESQNRQLVQAQNSRSVLPYQEVGAKLDELLRVTRTLQNDVVTLRSTVTQLAQSQQQVVQQMHQQYMNGVKPFPGNSSRPGKTLIGTGTGMPGGGASGMRTPSSSSSASQRPTATGLLLQKPSDLVGQDRQQAFIGVHHENKGGGANKILPGIRVSKEDTKSRIDVKTIQTRRSMQLRQFKEKHGEAGSGEEEEEMPVEPDSMAETPSPAEQQFFEQDQGGGPDDGDEEKQFEEEAYAEDGSD